jgi:hypothetical protein
MPKRALNNLKSLGEHASGVTKRTRLSIAYQTKKSNLTRKENDLTPGPVRKLMQPSPLDSEAGLFQIASGQPSIQNNLIFLTTAHEDHEDLGNAQVDGSEGTPELLHGSADEDSDDNGYTQDDEELFGPTDLPEDVIHEGDNSDSELVVTQSTPICSLQHTEITDSGAFAWELRKPPSMQSAIEAVHELKNLLRPH